MYVCKWQFEHLPIDLCIQEIFYCGPAKYGSHIRTSCHSLVVLYYEYSIYGTISIIFASNLWHESSYDQASNQSTIVSYHIHT